MFALELTLVVAVLLAAALKAGVGGEDPYGEADPGPVDAGSAARPASSSPPTPYDWARERPCPSGADQ